MLKQAAEILLDLPLEWQEKAAEKDIDTLHTANTIEEIVEFLADN